uniref:Uncharacterized protein n=1 Tax=Nelumbo nucifera TaxID=4432 RepID=A0A822YHI4_NELNU|nr:TPA_asm: hypothetical protein HUJ06_009237 [Nelumbo nucifera]
MEEKKCENLEKTNRMRGKKMRGIRKGRESLGRQVSPRVKSRERQVVCKIFVNLKRERDRRLVSLGIRERARLVSMKRERVDPRAGGRGEPGERQ